MERVYVVGRREGFGSMRIIDCEQGSEQWEVR